MERYSKIFDWVVDQKKTVQRKLEETVEDGFFDEITEHAKNVLVESTAVIAGGDAANVLDTTLGQGLEALGIGTNPTKSHPASIEEEIDNDDDDWVISDEEIAKELEKIDEERKDVTLDGTSPSKKPTQLNGDTANIRCLSSSHSDYWIFRREFTCLCLSVLSVMSEEDKDLKDVISSIGQKSSKVEVKESYIRKHLAKNHEIQTGLRNILSIILEDITPLNKALLVRLLIDDLKASHLSAHHSSLRRNTVDDEDNSFHAICHRLLIDWYELHNCKTIKSISEKVSMNDVKLTPRLPWFDENHGVFYFDYTMIKLILLSVGDANVVDEMNLCKDLYDPFVCQRNLSKSRAFAFVPSRRHNYLTFPKDVEYSRFVNGVLHDDGYFIEIVQTVILDLLSKDKNLLRSSWTQTNEFLELSTIANLRQEVILNTESLLVEWTGIAIRSIFIDYFSSSAFIVPILFELISLIYEAHAEGIGDEDRRMIIPHFTRDKVEVELSPNGKLDISEELVAHVILEEEGEISYKVCWKLTQDDFLYDKWLNSKTSLLLGAYYDFHCVGEIIDDSEEQNNDSIESLKRILNKFVIGIDNCTKEGNGQQQEMRLRRSALADTMTFEDTKLLKKSVAEGFLENDKSSSNINSAAIGCGTVNLEVKMELITVNESFHNNL